MKLILGTLSIITLALCAYIKHLYKNTKTQDEVDISIEELERINKRKYYN